MSINNSSNCYDSSSEYLEVPIPRPVRFWLFIVFNVPSVICSICIIIHIIKSRAQRSALYNHCILLILIFNLPVQTVDISFFLMFFHLGYVQPPRPALCLTWWLIDYGFYFEGMNLMTWLAVERHILIFHDRLVSTSRGRLLFHYLPMAIIVVYFLVFYVVVMFLLPCQNTYDYTLPMCNPSPCYESYDILGMWEYIVNTSAPVLIEAIASISFLIRVHLQRKYLRRSSQWRKNRRLILQLLFFSFLNISVNVPPYFIPLAHFCGLSPEDGVQAQLYFYFLGYFVIFLFPFTCLLQYRDLRSIIKNKLFCRISQEQHCIGVSIPMMAKTRQDAIE